MNEIASQLTAPAPPDALQRGRRTVWTVLGTWFIAATLLALAVPITSLPGPLVPTMILGTLLTWLGLYRASADVRAYLSTVPLWVPIAYNVIRLPIGIGFLIESAAGRMPASVAIPGGWGDIAAGALALVVLPWSGAKTRLARRLVLCWNALALADILMVIFRAQRVILFGEGPSVMQNFAEFPYAWLPGFIVPMVLASHLWLFARVRWGR